MIIFGFIMIVADILFSVARYITALINVEQHSVSTNLGYILLFTIMPFIWWAYSTKEENWNFYNIKKITLKMAVICSVMTIASPIWTLVFDTLVIRVCRIPVGRNLDAPMIMNLCRILLVLIPGVIGYGIISSLFNYFKRPDIEKKIDHLKWQLIFDTRKNKDWKYDLSILRNLKTGSSVKIKEEDRRVHMLIPGQSGTGKTSSILIPAMICDLNNKTRNMVQRHKLLKQMIKDKKARVTRPAPFKPIDESCVVANPGYEEELAEIRSTYGDCGMTVMAPDNDMHTQIITLSKARHLKVNAIDPVKLYKKKNVTNCSINPFYIPKGLSNEDRLIMIIEKAQTFASVIVAVNDLSGGGEQYFKDINKSVTTNIATLCMLHANLKGTQTHMSEIQSCINEMYELQRIVDEIQADLHIKVKVFEFGKKEKQETITSEQLHDMEMNSEAGSFDFYKIENEKDMPEWAKAQKLTVAECNETMYQEACNYYNAIHSVLLELLGSGAEDMFNQTRGLRTIIDKMMVDPRFKRILDGKDENLLDFEEAFKNNEITVINTGIRVNTDNSTALGLFILMMMKNATVRRPENTRSCHFLYVDEASQYMHPVYEDMFALYRKYNVSCVLALQTLSQMDKTPVTRYLKGVLTGAGIHIVYGRASADEMKFYEELGGKSFINQMQTAVTENSEFDDRYNITRSTRSQLTLEANTQAHDIRGRNFQEVTVFMVDEGNVKDGFLAKASFPNKKEFEEREVETVDFKELATFDPDSNAPVRAFTAPEFNAKEAVNKGKTSAKAVNRRKTEVLRMDVLKSLDEDEILEEIEEQRRILKEKYGKTGSSMDDNKKTEDSKKDQLTAENDDATDEILRRYGIVTGTKGGDKPPVKDEKQEGPEEKKKTDSDILSRESTIKNDSFPELFAEMGISSIETIQKPTRKKVKKKSGNPSPDNKPGNDVKKARKNKGSSKNNINGQSNIIEDEALDLIRNSLNNGTFG